MYLACIDDINSMGLRVRVYGGDRLRRDRLIGEKFVAFSSLDFDEVQEEKGQGRGRSLEKLVELEPRSNIEVTLLALFPKVLKIQRPKALKIDVFDYPLSFDAPLQGTPAIIRINLILSPLIVCVYLHCSFRSGLGKHVLWNRVRTA